MKAILCTHFGPPDELELGDIPPPTAGPGEAVIGIKAAALNFFDLLIIAGKYQHKPPFPFSPAAEFAGVVESIGAGVTGFAPGDRVIGWTGWGAARESLAAGTSHLVKLPANLDFERAAGLTVTYATTLYGLRERGKLTSGETLVVLGASGGTGNLPHTYFSVCGPMTTWSTTTMRSTPASSAARPSSTNRYHSSAAYSDP